MSKKNALLTVVIMFFTAISPAFSVDHYTIALARAFSKDIFELNGVPYLQPMVESINATSNSGFFNQAYVPRNVDKPYFRVGVRGMIGFVREDSKTYNPKFPNEPLSLEKLGQYITLDFSDITNPKVKSINDTAGLIHYAFLVYVNRGLEDGSITSPGSAPTVMGSRQGVPFHFPKGALDSLVKNYPSLMGRSLYSLMSDEMKAVLDSTIKHFPEYFTLPGGGDLRTLVAGIPQIEIGSLWGTELLLRFIPPVDLGEYVGDFAFWGVGLKHSISQYFEGRPFDLAVQAVYQGTSLNNIVGVTKAELKAVSTIWDFNVQIAKHFEGIIDIYSGISYDMITIHSDYKYYLPVEVQAALGLLSRPDAPPEPPEYPGDNQPQTVNLKLTDSNFKVVFGLAREFGPLSIYVDYNISKIHIVSGGISFKF